MSLLLYSMSSVGSTAGIDVLTGFDLSQIDSHFLSAGLQYCSSYSATKTVNAVLVQMHGQSVGEQPLCFTAMSRLGCYTSLVLRSTRWQRFSLTAQAERFARPRAFVPPTDWQSWIESVNIPKHGRRISFLSLFLANNQTHRCKDVLERSDGLQAAVSHLSTESKKLADLQMKPRSVGLPPASAAELAIHFCCKRSFVRSRYKPRERLSIPRIAESRRCSRTRQKTVREERSKQRVKGSLWLRARARARKEVDTKEIRGCNTESGKKAIRPICSKLHVGKMFVLHHDRLSLSKTAGTRCQISSSMHMYLIQASSSPRKSAGSNILAGRRRRYVFQGTEVIVKASNWIGLSREERCRSFDWSGHVDDMLVLKALIIWSAVWCLVSRKKREREREKERVSGIGPTTRYLFQCFYRKVPALGTDH